MIYLFKKKKNFFRLEFTRGFTLIETFVAISIIMVAVAGPLFIVSNALSSSYYARDQIIAFYLAQDAVEFIRNQRDENKLNSRSWLSGLDSCLNQQCYVDTQEGSIFLGASPFLKFEDGIYGYSRGADTSFKRTIKINSPDGDNEVIGNDAIISVNISWTTGILNRNFDVKVNIFNWQWQE